MRIRSIRLSIAVLATAVATTTTGVASADIDFGSSGGNSGSSSLSSGDMVITLVRHAESAGNTSGLIDTKVPGPDLTARGKAQADKLATQLADKKYDCAFASNMVRTSQTAAPTVAKKNLSLEVQPGFREIEAGQYEGTPEAEAMSGYLQAPIKWLSGDLSARIPGSIDGNEFDGRVDQALLDVQRRGCSNPVIFSHGGTIMFWAMMNADNADKSKLGSDPMRNGGHVILKGNPKKGWTITEWVGHPDLG
ncbi:histidine phosphatase family protein [Nocardia yamanashiensis]|uniref:histidine phosphatase family protein n=1 Tax=Nocardia yamanashiensis TaxID=209247 RepID=UPI001E37FEB9|nr:histidine phosphatase family protein [Nocardia yamanashiensis]UGT38821.1 histidine phosphatase family protein [Nocardia yamanashiensis]